MLHDSHELDDVVTKIPDTRKRVSGELLVCTDPVLARRNTDMGLIDPCTRRLRRTLVLELVSLRRGRVPEPRLVNRGYGQILGDSGDPSRDALDARARG